MPTATTKTTTLPKSCDYLVIGGGATGMAFVDTLLKYKKSSPCVVVMVDQHPQPGGQWNDSYSFVQLHQPSNMYGVETMLLEEEESVENDPHRATRIEILEYYQRVQQTLQDQYAFYFLGGVTFDMSQLSSSSANNQDVVVYQMMDTAASNTKMTIQVTNKVVDARFLQPDLPIFVPPKFRYNPDTIQCLAVNSLMDDMTSSSKQQQTQQQHYVILGAGKTGMDAIVYLLTQVKSSPKDILWVVPHEAWITAREEIGSCMEFLHTCTQLLAAAAAAAEDETADVSTSVSLFQKAFHQWETQGKVYRFNTNILPTKFKDATLSKKELELLQTVTQVVRNGRVDEIRDNGDLHFEDGSTVALPAGWSVNDTTFVHCTAGAFNYTKQQTAEKRPVFGKNLITIQDVYGTPGFCFVGSIIGKLEALSNLTDDEKNAMCLAPQPDPEQAKLPLGPSGGDIGVLSPDHGYVQRLSNLRQWMQVPEIKQWLVGHRLFNLRHYTAEELYTMVEDTWSVLQERGIIVAE